MRFVFYALVVANRQSKLLSSFTQKGNVIVGFSGHLNHLRDFQVKKYSTISCGMGIRARPINWAG